MTTSRNATKKALWAECPACGHRWPAAYYPIPLGRLAKILKDAACPKGCEKPPLVAKQRDGVLQEETQK